MSADVLVEARRPSHELPSFKFPKKGYLNEATRRKEDLKADGDRYFDSLRVTAPRRGFREFDSFQTPSGATWLLSDRPNHPIQEFPDGETITHSALAIYERFNNSLRVTTAHLVILRVSPEPIVREEFRSDIRTLSSGFVERSPLVSALRSDYLARLSGGGVVGGSVAFLAGAGELSLSIGAMTGFTILGLSSAASWIIESRALDKIVHIDQYLAARKVIDYFNAEEVHTREVTLQRAFYERFKRGWLELSPETFLLRFYNQMPKDLINEKQRILSDPTKTEPTPTLSSVDLEHLLTVARTLPTYRNHQAELLTPTPITPPN